MVKRWILYLVALIGCIIFFAAYQGWIAWLMLMMVVFLPLLSLLLSLAPMLLVRPSVDCPGAVTAGDRETLEISIHSPLPLPPCRSRFRVTHVLSGQNLTLQAGGRLPTGHCGLIRCTCLGFYVYDYMGLFRIRLRKFPEKQILVRPKSIAMKPPAELDRFLARSWQPKYGGGFAENHELRLYRPGDGLNQVHWKLSAKTGKLIIREPMVPRHGRVLLTLDLCGTPVQIDRKIGRLLWMSQYLLEKELPHEVHALTGDGVQVLPIRCEDDLPRAVDALLRCAPAADGTILNSRVIASWQYHIGGDEHEA